MPGVEGERSHLGEDGGLAVLEEDAVAGDGRQV